MGGKGLPVHAQSAPPRAPLRISGGQCGADPLCARIVLGYLRAGRELSVERVAQG
ncbi:hypothetical protein GCM10010279_23170 [Streptomyces mutabilis]|nr:hypothetical protein GCM10010279_23170 [Streptomyces mutabilis]